MQFNNEKIQEIEHQLEHYTRVANTIGQDVMDQLEHELGLTGDPEAMSEMIRLATLMGMRLSKSSGNVDTAAGTGFMFGLLFGLRMAGKGKLEVAA